MSAQSIETEATILDVTDDSSWKYSINADIPAFDGDRPYRYLAWNKKQGPPPQVGATGRATFQAYQRSKFYIDRGDLPAGPVDGLETHYMVSWNMTAFAGAVDGVADAPSTTTPANAPVRAAQTAQTPPSVTYLSAPSVSERDARDTLKWRLREEGVNDRKAITDVLEMGRTTDGSLYANVPSLLLDAETLAAWYNTRLAARCDSPLVGAAQSGGAVVVGVVAESADTPPGPTAEVGHIKNRPDLNAFVLGKGWGKADITRVIQDAGYGSSAAYLADSDNSVQGLAQLLTDHLDIW